MLKVNNDSKNKVEKNATNSLNLVLFTWVSIKNISGKYDFSMLLTDPGTYQLLQANISYFIIIREAKQKRNKNFIILQ